MQPTSATKRLTSILTRIQSAAVKRAANDTVRNVLSDVLKIDPDDLPGLHRAYSRLLALADHAHSEVLDIYSPIGQSLQAREAEAADAIRPINGVRGTLLGNSIHSKAGVLTSFPLGELGILSLTATKVSAERELSEDEIARARALVQEALDGIRDSSLDSRFKVRVTASMEEVLRLLDEYDLYGPEAVVETISHVMTVVATTRHHVTPDQAPVVVDSLSRMADAVSIVTGGFVLGHDVLPALLRLLGAG